jgi:serine O-acetyltransferase
MYEKSKYKNIHSLWLVFPVAEQDYIWRCQWLLRHLEFNVNCNHKVAAAIFKILYNRVSVKLGLHIPENTCGRGLKIMHTGSILINGKASLGEDVSLHINTSIVAHGITGGVPRIGNNVVIGVGAVVLGDVYIADGIAIGANAVVNSSFNEQNIAIAGVPARKISNNGRLAWAGKKERE